MHPNSPTTISEPFLRYKDSLNPLIIHSMKRMILLLMCAAIGLTQAQAQLSFGVKAGANFSTISKIDLSSIGPGGKALSGLFESKYMPGYHVGLYTRYNLTPAMGVQAELLYSMMGYKITSPLIADASVKTQLHYLTVPVLFRYTVPNIGLYAELGPQAGFFLKDNITVTGSLGGRSSYITESGSKQAASLDLSGVAGLGYRFDNGLSISARYIHEFKTSSGDHFIPTYAKKRGFQVSVAYELF